MLAKFFRSMIHRVSHWRGTSTGSVETWHQGDVLMVGFLCDCGEMIGVHRAPDSFQQRKESGDAGK